MRRRWRKTLIITGTILLVGFILLNVVAYRHAWAMTHFIRDGGQRTAPPEKLSLAGKLKVLFTGVAIPRPGNQRTPKELGLEYQNYRFTGAKGLELEAWQLPQEHAKATVIIFHGYASTKDSQLDTAAELRAMGCECWLVDFHGSGGSAGDTTSIGWDEGKDVAASYRYVKSHTAGKRIILLGSSLGAAAILQSVAHEEIQPDGLILECPFNNLLDTTGNRFRTMGLPAFPLANLLVFWGGKQFGFDGFSHNPADYAKAVHCPTLLMNGDNDPRVTLNNFESIRANLPPETQSVVFKDTGHESYLKKHPDEWKHAVEALLQIRD